MGETRRMASPAASPENPTLPLAPDDGADPELLALPDPPKGERRWTLALLVGTALASAAMAVTLRGEASYALSSGETEVLGALSTVAARGASYDNRYVRADGVLGSAGGIRFERPFTSDSFRVAPLPGHRDVWVELRVPAGAENGRFVPKASFEGRLVRFSSAGPKHRGLAASIERVTGEAVPEGAWLLVDEEAPKDARWAIVLLALFSAFCAWNLGVCVRLFRRAKS